MIDSQNSFLKPVENLRNLQVLEEISRDSCLSQRKLSRRLGIALGVTNACLKKMIKKGYVKIKGINHKRLSYYLTPQGISEKSKLTYHFLQHTISYYQNLKKNIAEKLSLLSQRGIHKIVYYGAGEVMEVAYITLQQTSLELIGIVDDDANKQGKKMFGFVIENPQIIKTLKPDAVLITSIRYRDKIMHSLNSDRELSGVNIYSL